MRLQTLGQLELQDGQNRPLANRSKTLALLAFVALHRTPVARSRVAELFWPDVPASRARHSLRQALAELRRALGAELRCTPDSIGVGALQLDADEVEALATAEPARAVALWKGQFLAGAEPLAGEELGDWIRSWRTRLDRCVGSACQSLVSAAIAAGDWDAAEARMAWWCENLPDRDAPLAMRRQVLRRVGRPAAARRLAEDLPTYEPDGACPDFVGRSDAIAAVCRAWRRADRSGGMVEVTGPAGIGKSRFAAELVRHVTELGEGHLAILVDGVAPREAASLVAALPSRSGRTLAIVDGVTPDDQELRTSVARVVRPGLLIVLCGRSDALSDTPLSGTVRRASRLELPPLDAAAAAHLVESMLPLESGLARQLGGRLAEDCAGVPRQMVAMIHQLVSEGLVGPGEDGRWELSRGLPKGPVPIPATPTERMRRRLERMTREARRVVEALAVLGPAASPEELAQVANVSGPVLRESLREASIRRLVQPRGAAPAALYNDALVEPVYALIPAARRRELHRRVARALRRRSRHDRQLATRVRRHRELARPRWASMLHTATRRILRSEPWLEGTLPADLGGTHSG